ncbi:MAG: hypothetical protein EBY63_07180, partial [Flavobacteriia bacterium]|nr:hypothetical protein [Flavobacteriia bacterium]
MRGQLTTADSLRTVQLWGLAPATHIPLGDLATRYSAFGGATLEYTKKNRDFLLDTANHDAAATTCTSGITDMSEMFYE